MIFLSSAAAWFLGTKAGRVMAAIVAVVLAIATFGWTMRRKGRAEQAARQRAADDDAVARANQAGAEFQRDGAQQRMKDGTF